MSTSRICIGIAVVGLLGACSDDADKDYGSARASTAQEDQAIEGLMDSAGSLRSLSSDPSSESAWGYVLAMYGQQNALMQGKLAAQYQGTSQSSNEIQAATLSECLGVSEDGRSIRYSQCEFAGVSIDGVLKWWDEPGGIAIDTNLAMDYGAANMTTDMDGTLVVTDNAIRTKDGGLRFATTIGTGEYLVHTDIESDWDVQISNDCATGGFVEMHSLMEVSGAANSVIDTWMLIEFGPACGQVSVR